MITVTQCDKLAPAMVKAIGELTDPHKSGKVNAGQRRYSYMMLPDLLAEIRKVFAGNGLALLQSVEYTDQAVHVTCTVLHESGQMLTTAPFLIRCAADAQSIGSATTYARRYSAAALVGLAGSDDDDGETAARRAEPLTKPVQRVQQKASDPDPYQTPVTQTPDARPVDPSERPDVGAPSTTNRASDKSKKMMWALLRGTGMDTDQTRLWMGSVLNRDGDWHTDDLTQFEVSSIIDRLKSEST